MNSSDSSVYNILTKLATRLNKNYTSWLFVNNYESYFDCLICNKRMHFNDTLSIVQMINDHGLQHLKDSNLLAFI